MKQIPQFDGMDVAQAHNALSGSDDDAPQVLHPGDETYLVVRGTVTGINHKEDRFGRLSRVQSIRVSHSMPADQDSIDAIRADMKRRQDEQVGQESLDDAIDGDEDGDADA